MADKRRVRRSIKQLQRFKTWQLAVVLVFLLLISATFLRLNNIGMVERRSAVFAADKNGSTDAVHDRLYDLQRYVSTHMNADTGVIYLEEQYKRDAKAVVTSLSDTGNPNGNIYKKASKVCDDQFLTFSQAYAQCYLTELEKYPAAKTVPLTATLPETSLYRHEYIAPLWSPDFAGISVLLCLFLILVIIARLISLAVLRLLLRRHYNSI